MSKSKNVKFIEFQEATDSNARAGRLIVNGYTIKTPIIWFGHNFDGPVCVWQNKNKRREGVKVLVNACEVISRPLLAKSICEQGLRNYLGYNGPVMMDSGGFLFQKNRNLNASPLEISNLYDRASIDIGVSLDHPFDPTLSDFENKKRWECTLRNTELMASYAKSYAFMPVIHGYTLRSLTLACNQIKRMLGNPPLVGLGSLVPLMKGSYVRDRFNYRRENGNTGDHVTFIVDAIMIIRNEFPKSMIHVFGAGGTTTILSLFALGADSVDSVAWRLKAAYGAIQLPGISDRFLSPRPNSYKARRVINEDESQVLQGCACPVCSRYKWTRWRKRKLDNSFKARCIHNAWVFHKEVQAFRKAILVGKTQAFLEKRLARTHRFFGVLLSQNETGNSYE